MRLSKKALTAIIAVSIAVTALPAGAVVLNEVSQFTSEKLLTTIGTSAYTSAVDYSKIGDEYTPSDYSEYTVQALDTDNDGIADAAAIVGFTEAGTSYTIPATVKDSLVAEDLPVIALLSTNTEACMTNASSIQVLDASEAVNLTEIGAYAFYNCTSLSSISSDSVQIVGNNAFMGCAGLTSVNLPNATTVNPHSFKNCEALSEITLSSSLTSTSRECFSGCKSLTYLKDENGNDLLLNETVIAVGAFSGCESLYPTISTVCETVGENAFDGVPYVTIQAENEEAIKDYCKNIKSSSTLLGLTTVEKVGILNSYDGGISIDIGDTSALQALNEGAPNTYNGVFYISAENYPEYSVDSIYNNLSTNALYLKYIEDGSKESEIITDAEGWKDIPLDLTVSVPNYSADKTYRFSSGSVGGDLSATEVYPFETSEGSGEYISTTSVSVENAGTIVSLTSDVFKTADSTKYPSSLEIVGFNFEGTENVTVTIPAELPSFSGEMTPVAALADGGGACLQGAESIRLLNLSGAKNLVEIGSEAFLGCENLTGGVRSRYIETVGNSAFVDCTGLVSVDLPNALTIGGGAFNSCAGLESVSLPSATTFEDDGNGQPATFAGCENLETVVLSSALETIPAELFSGLSNLTTVTDNEEDVENNVTGVNLSGVKTVGNKAFNGCTELKSVSLPSATTFGADERGVCNTFANCENLETVVLSSALETIPAYLFSSLSKLTTVTDNEEDVENNITGVNLSGVKTVGDVAFDCCIGLESVNLPNASTIGYAAFTDCENLETVVLSSALETIPAYLFNGLSNLTTVTDNEEDVENNVTGVNLSGVKTVGEYAFSSCAGLESVSLPSATTFEDDGDGICYTFANCENLETVVLSSALETIPAYLFSSLSKLTTVTDNEEDVENNITGVNLSGVKTVGACAFNGCTELKSVSLPSATTFGADERGVCNTFAYCENLETVVLSSALETIPAYLFDGLSNLTTVTDNEEDVENNVTGVNLSGVKTVGEYAFNSCAGLESVNMPNASTIGNDAFCNCKNLETVVLSPALETIPINSFAACLNLTSLKDESGNDLLLNVKYIGNSAFLWCEKFYPTISSSVCTYVGESAFDGGVQYLTIQAENEEALKSYCGSIEDGSDLLGLQTVDKIGTLANVPEDIYVDHASLYVDDSDNTYYATVETTEYEKDGCTTEIAANIFVKAVSNYGESTQVEDDVNIKLSIPEARYDSNRVYYLDAGFGNLIEANLTLADGMYTSDIITANVSDQGLMVALVSVVEFESVTINGNDSLTYGENENKATYTITTNPQDASYSRVEWSSSDEDVLKFEDSFVGEATIVGKGSATITATVYQINEGKESAVDTFDVNVNPGDMTELVANSYSGEYDGQEHSITVSGAPEGSTIKYSVDGGETWSNENPKYTDVCSIQVDCMVENVNYNTALRQATLDITPAAVDVPSKAPSMTARTENSITLLEVTDGTTQQGDDYTVEYGIDKGDGNIIWQDSVEFTGLASEETYNFYTRYKITDDEKVNNYQNNGYSAASEPAEYTTEAKDAPEAPELGEGITIDYDSETITVNPGYEASYNQDFSDSVKGEATIEARPGETLYVRVPADTENRVPASKTSINHLPARAEAPKAEDAYTIDYDSETITINPGYEASYNQDFSDSVKGEGTIKARPGETLYFRNSAGDGAFAGEYASEDLKARPQTPEAPIVNLTGSTTITVVNPTEGQEYKLLSINPDGTTNEEGEWTDETVFKNLTSEKTYTVVTRIKFTDSDFASNESGESNYITTTDALSGPGSVTLDGGKDGSTWTDKETGTDYSSGLFVPMTFRLTGEPVYDVSISWGDMTFKYDSTNGWGNSFDSVNNQVTVTNNSELSVQSTIVFALEDPTDQEIAALGFNLVDVAGNPYVSMQKLTAKGTEDSSTTAYLIADTTKEPPANRNEKIGTITVEVEEY